MSEQKAPELEDSKTSNNEEESFYFDDNPEVIELKKNLKGMSKDAIKKVTSSIRSEISSLNDTIQQLKRKRAEANSQARHYRSMRNNTNDDKFSQIERMREEAVEHKEQRDHCNEQIQVYKQKREDLKESIQAAWAKVKELREKYYKMKDEVGVLPEDLTEEIRSLEWKQQTEQLSTEEDAEITKRIGELYEKAYAAHSIGYSSDDLEATVEQAKKMSEEHDLAHEMVLKLAEEGQKHHEQMLALYKKIDSTRTTGNDLHSRFVEARQAADVAHQQIVDHYEKIKLNQFLLDLIDEEQARRRIEKAKELREEKIIETKQKQKSSKRLSLDELRLLMGEDDE